MNNPSRRRGPNRLYRLRSGSRRPLRAFMAMLLALTMAPLLPTAALAHGTLQRASPGDGDQLSVAPRELRLTFTEDVELDLTRLVLTGPSGAVALAPLALHPDSATVLVAPIHGSLVAGTYKVEWQVVGEDGHPVRGEYSFTIAPDAEGLAVTGPATSAPTTAVTQATQTTPSPEPAEDSSGSSALLWIIGIAGLGALALVAFKLSRPGTIEEHG